MSYLKDKALASIDELVSTGDILLKNLRVAGKDNGDSAMEAISVMLLQLINAYGPTHPVAKHLFPAMHVIKSKIDEGNYVGAIWDAETLIKSLKEIRTIVESTKE